MGLSITPEMIQEHNAVVAANSNQQVEPVRQTPSGGMQVAPISGNAVGLQRAEIKQGVREVILCKDGDGKIGLRVRSINKVQNFILCT